MLDFSQPLSMLIPYICRRFGIRFTDFDYLRLEDGIGIYLIKIYNLYISKYFMGKIYKFTKIII